MASTTAFTTSACCPREAVRPTPVLSCPPVILMEPPRTERPEVTLRYKIEEGKEWFALDREGYVAIRDYIIRLEGSVDFAGKEIAVSNEAQKRRREAEP